MGIIRNTLLTRLWDKLHVPVEQREHQKSHTNNARWITGFPKAVLCDVMSRNRAIRHHNRQIHRAKFLKGGIRKNNQALYQVKRFRL